MIIGTVVEGPTDRLVLQTVLGKLIPGEHRFLPLQPKDSYGETGTGWKGVRRWCRQTWQLSGSSLATVLAPGIGPALDLLIIHVDADIAAEHDLQEDDPEPVPDIVQHCPPAALTAGRLALVIGHWLHYQDLPLQVVLAIPAQDTENWTFAALFPGDGMCARPDYECTKSGANRPCYKLTLQQYGRLLQRSGGEIKKSVRQYETVLGRIATGWDGVRQICPQAEQFSREIVERSQPEWRACS